MQRSNKLQDLASLICDSGYCVVFTGAGVSTLSGIKDFRGSQGLYNTVSPEIADKIFDIQWFEKHPEFFYKHTRDFIYNLEEKTPSLVHSEVARWENNNINLKAVVTQNIDLLHRKAGSNNVVEVHGSPAIHRCRQCHREYSFNNVVAMLGQTDLPRCAECSGVLKPGITFFGESLPAEAVARAIDHCSNADLLIVLGSSLLVQPAASFPMHTLENNGRLVIVNNEPTPLDRYAHMLFEDLEEVFRYTRDAF